MKLRTSSDALDRINQAIDATRRSSTRVTVDKAALFALVTDHRDLCGLVIGRGGAIEEDARPCA